MLLFGRHYRSIWVDEQALETVCVIDQRHLPYRLVIETLRTEEDTAAAIRDMHVRGAGLIGAAAAYGVWLAVCRAGSDPGQAAQAAGRMLAATRPTAVNLTWAADRVCAAVRAAGDPPSARQAAYLEAGRIADEDAASCRAIGRFGADILAGISRRAGRPINILTHCNAGSLAFVDYGTATAPIYEAHRRGIRLHIYVDETRPLNQGSKLTAFELGQNGIPHTIITDNAGGHLMQHGLVDAVLVGSDRTTRTGDVANKIGTYLKALAAHAHHVPFYVALPISSIDWQLTDGVREIPIETRSEDEVLSITGQTSDGRLETVRLAPQGSRAANYGFDVTPARYVTALITEKGVCEASETGLKPFRPD
ncbi:MAG: S-methyl-5-thioribose-1-phosphate isomerase [Clostridiaceae bacterium]|jgi:methylthioribose-1-phosphate isomerase|nr:S-methyl-5-thioribose-1-phosphate isomerase [Clostridiaceae bacterium]